MLTWKCTMHVTASGSNLQNSTPQWTHNSLGSMVPYAKPLCPETGFTAFCGPPGWRGKTLRPIALAEMPFTCQALLMLGPSLFSSSLHCFPSSAQPGIGTTVLEGWLFPECVRPLKLELLTSVELAFAVKIVEHRIKRKHQRSKAYVTPLRPFNALQAVELQLYASQCTKWATKQTPESLNIRR